MFKQRRIKKMTIRNCKKCGKIYQYDGTHKICMECRRKEEENFEKVKEYLRDNPKANINTVSEKTGVPKKEIIEFIKNDRLIAEDMEIDITIKCDRCGKEIKHGKYCDSCIADMKEEIESIKKEKEAKDKKKPRRRKENMHVSDRWKNN
jgi:flagellar operon protein (TIGR03826 family)